MIASSENIPWSRLRFLWKQTINRRSDLPRSAKQFASYVCDECVNRKDGCFYHQSKTMADAMGVNVRSVQRYLAVLQRGGWLRKVKKGNRRRVFQLSMPAGIEPAPELSRTPENATDLSYEKSASKTKLSRKSDKTVVPYKNQGNNNKKEKRQEKRPAYLELLDTEAYLLSRWQEYIETNTALDWSMLVPKLQAGTRFRLPARHPPTDEKGRKKALEFFAYVLQEG